MLPISKILEMRLSYDHSFSKTKKPIHLHTIQSSYDKNRQKKFQVFIRYHSNAFLSLLERNGESLICIKKGNWVNGAEFFSWLRKYTVTHDHCIMNGVHITQSRTGWFLVFNN